MEQEQKQIMIPEDLAKEFTDWARPKSFCNSGQHVVDRIAAHIEKQLMPYCSYGSCISNRQKVCVKSLTPQACGTFNSSKV